MDSIATDMTDMSDCVEVTLHTTATNDSLDVSSEHDSNVNDGDNIGDVDAHYEVLFSNGKAYRRLCVYNVPVGTDEEASAIKDVDVGQEYVAMFENGEEHVIAGHMKIEDSTATTKATSDKLKIRPRKIMQRPAADETTCFEEDGKTKEEEEGGGGRRRKG